MALPRCRSHWSPIRARTSTSSPCTSSATLTASSQDSHGPALSLPAPCNDCHMNCRRCSTSGLICTRSPRHAGMPQSVGLWRILSLTRSVTWARSPTGTPCHTRRHAEPRRRSWTPVCSTARPRPENCTSTRRWRCSRPSRISNAGCGRESTHRPDRRLLGQCVRAGQRFAMRARARLLRLISSRPERLPSVAPCSVTYKG